MIHNDAKRAFLYPTMRCNLKCAICYSGAHKPIVQERMKEELTFEEYKMVVDKLYGMGVRIFDISGGEPLLCEFIYDLIRYIKSYRDTQIYLVSNGTLIEKELSKIAEVITMIDRFQISIDSSNKEIHDEMRGVKGTFERAVKGIQLLQSLNYDGIGINSVITSRNESTVIELLNFAKKMNLSRVQLLRFIDVVEKQQNVNHNVEKDDYMKIYYIVSEWVKKYKNTKLQKNLSIELVLPGCLWRESLKIPKTRVVTSNNISLYVQYDPFHGCPAFKNSIVITAYGDITGCTGLVNIKDFHCGNIKEESVQGMEEKFSKKILFIKEREEYLKTKEPCSKCKEYNSCKGGCIAATYNYYGNTGYADPTCIQHA